MRRAYEKPVMTVERFLANVAVAACERVWSGEVSTSWPKQPITCNRLDSTTDYIFASGTAGCDYQPCHMVYIAEGGTYTPAYLNTLGLSIQGVSSGSGSGGHGGSSSGGSVTVPAGGGYVLCWANGNHYGPAAPEIVKLMTSSF